MCTMCVDDSNIRLICHGEALHVYTYGDILVPKLLWVGNKLIIEILFSVNMPKCDINVKGREGDAIKGLQMLKLL